MNKRTFLKLLFFTALCISSCERVREIFGVSPKPPVEVEIKTNQQLSDDDLRKIYFEQEGISEEFEDPQFDMSVSNVGEEAPTSSASTTQPNLYTTTSSANAEASRYHIIVGSFKIQANAQTMMKRLSDNGYQPVQFYLRDGYYAVSASSYNNISDANSAMRNMRQYPTLCPYDSWVYDINIGLHRDLGR